MFVLVRSENISSSPASLLNPGVLSHRAPPSMGFSGKEYWVGCHCKSLPKFSADKRGSPRAQLSPSRSQSDLEDAAFSWQCPQGHVPRLCPAIMLERPGTTQSALRPQATQGGGDQALASEQTVLPLSQPAETSWERITAACEEAWAKASGWPLMTALEPAGPQSVPGHPGGSVLAQAWVSWRALEKPGSLLPTSPPL